MLMKLFLLESRSLFRNKRLLTLLVNALFLIAFGIIIIGDDEPAHGFLDRFWIFVTIVSPIIVFGILVFSKDGVFYDTIHTKRILLPEYVKAKLFLLFTLIFFSFSLVLCFSPSVSTLNKWLMFAIAIYSLGVGMPLLIYVSSFVQKKIDYRRSAFFNYEGMVVIRQFVTIPPMLPFVFFPKFLLISIILMFLSGLVGLFLLRLWIRLITKTLARRKYLMLEGFRQ